MFGVYILFLIFLIGTVLIPTCKNLATREAAAHAIKGVNEHIFELVAASPLVLALDVSIFSRK